MTGSEDYDEADDLPILAEIGIELSRLFREEGGREARWPRVHRKLGLRARVTVSVVAVLVTASAAAAAVTLTTAGHSEPIHVPHGGIQCPAGYPDLTSSQTGLVYPADYPGIYPPDRGTSCYSSIRAAVADKYKVAPTPTGDVQLGQFYMGPTSASDNDLCMRARHSAGAVIYCPTMLPVPAVRQQNFDCPRAGCTYFTLTRAFSGPNNYLSASYAGGGQITVWAWSAKQASENPGQEGCENPRKEGSTTFRGHHAEWLQCPVQGGMSPLFDSTDIKVLEWQIGDEQYGVSADGPAGRELATYVATHLKPEAPAS